jgi:hypothetical protein
MIYISISEREFIVKRLAITVARSKKKEKKERLKDRVFIEAGEKRSNKREKKVPNPVKRVNLNLFSLLLFCFKYFA